MRGGSEGESFVLVAACEWGGGHSLSLEEAISQKKKESRRCWYVWRRLMRPVRCGAIAGSRCLPDVTQLVQSRQDVSTMLGAVTPSSRCLPALQSRPVQLHNFSSLMLSPSILLFHLVAVDD